MWRGAAAGLLLLAAAGAAAAPEFAAVRAAQRSSEGWLLDRDGEALAARRADPQVRRLPWVALGEISPALVEAVLVAEDRHFRVHAGVDWSALAAAAWGTLAGSPRRGASTLSMQVAALVEPGLGHGGRDPRRKWQQVQAALRLDAQWSKDQILEAYLNLVTFRGELTGVDAASRGLFGKAPSGLDRTESALLAALLPAPNAPAARVARRACALRARLPDWPGDCDRLQALARAALAAPPQVDTGPALAPHLAQRLAPGAGERLRTSLDGGLQRFASEALREQLAELRGRAVEDGAAVVLDNRSGEILAYVGAVEATSQAPAVDGVRARRQAGSTLKPFLYAAALDGRLLTAASLLEDAPLAVATSRGHYVPQDYDHVFRGWVSVRTALASSLNVPAVRALDLVGIEALLARLRALGFTGLDHDAEYYGPALALGSAEVSLLELANAYRTLANGGVWSPLRERPADGSPPVRRRVYSEATSFLIADILADRAARAPTFGLDSALESSGFAAVKTGTSKDMRDNWCVGFDRRHTVAVWVGNASGAPMHDVSGVTGAAPVWQRIMARLATPAARLAPRPPAGLVHHAVRFPDLAEPARTEWFLPGTAMGTWSTARPAALARIIGPGDGAVLAVDRDAPMARQRAAFRAQPQSAELRWLVDGQQADADTDADGTLWWPLQRGLHQVALVDGTGTTLDSQSLRVK